MNEHSLRSAIKNWYSLPNDEIEVNIGGFVVDVTRGNLLIEIQTKNFSAIKKKLEKMAMEHRVRLVYAFRRDTQQKKVSEERKVG